MKLPTIYFDISKEGLRIVVLMIRTQRKVDWEGYVRISKGKRKTWRLYSISYVYGGKSLLLGFRTLRTLTFESDYRI